jgi:hypothetical protein
VQPPENVPFFPTFSHDLAASFPCPSRAAGQPRSREQGCLIAPTTADIRDVMVAGPSGLLAVAPPSCRPRFENVEYRQLAYGATGLFASTRGRHRVRVNNKTRGVTTQATAAKTTIRTGTRYMLDTPICGKSGSSPE